MRRRRARSGLRDFTCYTKPDYEPSWHHDRLCTLLDRFVAGDLDRLIINMPPQYGKSELTSRRLPAYLLGRNPDLRVIACSHTAGLASAMNRDVQKILDDDAYRCLFPNTRLSGKNVRTVAGPLPLRNSEMFELVGARGYYKSAGVGGAIAGRGFDVGIIDDPVRNREEADSPTVRESVWKWYTGDFYTRRGKNARILLTMTRWNEDDLAGRLLRLQEDDPKADRWTVLRLPAICEHHEEGDPRQPGEPLWPARYPLSDLEKIRAASPYDFASQYQQHPRPEGGTEWPEDYFGPGLYFDAWPADLLLKGIALDPSKGKEAKFGDYRAYVWGGLDAAGTLWVDADLEREPTPRIVDRGVALYRAWPCQGFAVEINAFQELLGVEFTRAGQLVGLTLPMYGINNTVNKNVRIRTLGPYLAQKRLRIQGGSKGARLLVQQLKDFPCGDHDDGPDALEMLVRLLAHLLGEQTANGAPTVLRA